MQPSDYTKLKPQGKIEVMPRLNFYLAECQIEIIKIALSINSANTNRTHWVYQIEKFSLSLNVTVKWRE